MEAEFGAQAALEESVYVTAVVEPDVGTEGQVQPVLPAAVLPDPIEVPANPNPVAADSGGKRSDRAGKKVPRWNQEEDQRLLTLVEQLGTEGKSDWASIAQQLGTGRTPTAVDQHWNILTGKRPKPSGKSPSAATGAAGGAAFPGFDEEEEVLIVSDAAGLNGEPVGPPAEALGLPAEALSAVPGTGGSSVPACIDGSDLDPAAVPATFDSPAAGGAAAGEPKKKRQRSGGVSVRWSETEDATLLALVDELGSKGHWAEIAERLGTGRTGPGVDQHWNILTGKRPKPSGTRKSTDAATPGAAPPLAGLAVDVVTSTVVLGGGEFAADGSGAGPSSAGGASLGPDSEDEVIDVVGEVVQVQASIEPAPEASAGGEGSAKKKRTRAAQSSARWTDAEDAQLLALVGELGHSGQWNTIAQRLGTGRTGPGCLQHWQILVGKRAKPSGKAGNGKAKILTPAEEAMAAYNAAVADASGGAANQTAEAKAAQAAAEVAASAASLDPGLEPID